MKSISELEALRKKALEELSLRNHDENSYKVVVGMATCGIAAGARPVLNAFVEEFKTRNIKNAQVSMTGCVGMCKLEPIVEVISPDGNKFTYVNMNEEKVKRVVAEHLVNGKVVEEFLLREEIL